MSIRYELVTRFEHAGCASTIDVLPATRRQARRLLRKYVGTTAEIAVRAPGYREVQLTVRQCERCHAGTCAGHNGGDIVRAELSPRMNAR